MASSPVSRPTIRSEQSYAVGVLAGKRLLFSIPPGSTRTWRDSIHPQTAPNGSHDRMPR